MHSRSTSRFNSHSEVSATTSWPGSLPGYITEHMRLTSSPEKKSWFLKFDRSFMSKLKVTFILSYFDRHDKVSL